MASYKQTQNGLDKLNTLKLQDTKNISVRRLVHRYLIKRDPTYDSKTGALQTAALRSRSPHDLYLTLKNYFPDTTYEQSSKIFKKLVEKRLLETWVCTTVNRRVCSPTNMNISMEKIGEVIDEANVGLKSIQRQKPKKL